jgi:hypothetical protein
VECGDTGLGLVPCEDAWGLGDVAQALGVDLLYIYIQSTLAYSNYFVPSLCVRIRVMFELMKTL